MVERPSCHFLQRRTFMKGGAAALAALNNFPYAAYAATSSKNATDRVKLGPMKVELSRMAQGSGTNGVGGSSNQTRKLGMKGLSDLFVSAYNNGVTFWDSADQYGTHPYIKEALKSVPRDKVQILTKTHASTADEMKKDLDRFRRELGTDYIDILLLHCMMDGDWPARKKGAMEVIGEAREKGIVKTHGTSCHTLEALKTAAKTDWVQVDLVRFNPVGIAMDSEPQTVLGVMKEMKAKGKGLIGMKVLGAGKLRNKVDEALQFHLAHNEIDCFTIGAESRAEQEELIRKIPAASTRG